MKNFSLILINSRSRDDKPGRYTYLSNVGKSVIDLGWCNVVALELINDFKTLNIVTHADHFLIII